MNVRYGVEIFLGFGYGNGLPKLIRTKNIFDVLWGEKKSRINLRKRRNLSAIEYY